MWRVRRPRLLDGSRLAAGTGAIVSPFPGTGHRPAPGAAPASPRRDCGLRSRRPAAPLAGPPVGSAEPCEVFLQPFAGADKAPVAAQKATDRSFQLVRPVRRVHPSHIFLGLGPRRLQLTAGLLDSCDQRTMPGGLLASHTVPTAEVGTMYARGIRRAPGRGVVPGAPTRELGPDGDSSSRRARPSLLEDERGERARAGGA